MVYMPLGEFAGLEWLEEGEDLSAPASPVIEAAELNISDPETTDERTYRKLSEWYLKQLRECQEELRQLKAPPIIEVGEQKRDIPKWFKIWSFGEWCDTEMPDNHNDADIFEAGTNAAYRKLAPASHPAPAPIVGKREESFVSKSCIGEKCPCGKDAAHKIAESIPFDDPHPGRHGLSRYVCEDHFNQFLRLYPQASALIVANADVGDIHVEDIANVVIGEALQKFQPLPYNFWNMDRVDYVVMRMGEKMMELLKPTV
jgi:hypothetical protein